MRRRQSLQNSNETGQYQYQSGPHSNLDRNKSPNQFNPHFNQSKDSSFYLKNQLPNNVDFREIDFSPYRPRQITRDPSPITKNDFESIKKQQTNAIGAKSQIKSFSPYLQKYRNTKEMNYNYLNNRYINEPANTSLRQIIENQYQKNLKYKIKNDVDIHSRIPNHNDHSKDMIIDELNIKNKHLSEQIVEYKQLVSRLEGEIKSTQHKNRIQNYEKQLIQQRQKNEILINEMKNQIVFLIQKNELMKKKNEQLNKQLYVFTQTQNHDKYYQLLQEITQIINLYKNSHFNFSEIKGVIMQTFKGISKVEAFCNCLLDMKAKVLDEKPDKDLKRCWKWLKNMVEEFIKLKKLKTELFKKLKFKQELSLQQIQQLILKKL